jgi:hypothetical protein
MRTSKRRSDSRISTLVRLLAPIAFSAIPVVANAAEWTGSKAISHLSFDGDSLKTIYFETPSGSWSAAGCPNARFVMVRGIDGLKEILALGITAKTTSTNVSFLGSCVDADYFSATYVKLD